MFTLHFAMSDRSRRFCFTWNNYPLDAEEQLRGFFNRKHGVYLVFGREVGESGTPHLQGYLHLKDATTFRALKSQLPLVHLERARGTGAQNREYCTKDADFVEIGTLPQEKGKAGKEAWSLILRKAEEGDWTWIKTEYPKVWVNTFQKIMSLRKPQLNVIDGDIKNEWWYGATGTGKSKLAWEKYGAICYQKMLNKWWDGYADEDVVIIEEWSPKNEVTASALKIWADRYPFSAQIKGGVLQKIRPKKIIVISNYRLEDCFPDSRDREPVERRFTKIEFPWGAQVATTKADEYLATLEVVGEPPSCDDAAMEEQDTTVDGDIEGLLDGIVPDDTLTFESQSWADFASPDDFNRLLCLGPDRLFP